MAPGTAMLIIVLALATVAQAQSAPVRDVSVTSRPRGALVRFDDDGSLPVGHTPVAHVRLSLGWHWLHFTLPGYIPYDLRAQVSDVLGTFRVTLTRAALLRVTSDVTGAIVTIDGTEAGTAPLDVDGLRAGEHTVDVRADGHLAFHADVRLRAGANPEVHATLE